jgi:hypothetical protein
VPWPEVGPLACAPPKTLWDRGDPLADASLEEHSVPGPPPLPRVYSHPAPRAMRMTSMWLRAPTFAIALDR